MKLNKTPFFLLDVSVTDGKNTIMSKAEELEFFGEETIVNSAMGTLLNPVKRLEAELSWFPHYVTESVIDRIKRAVANNESIEEAGLNSYGLLNAIMYNFEGKGNYTIEELQIAIEKIDKVYDSLLLDVERIVAIINSSRSVAGITEITANDVAEKLQSKREDIRAIINNKFSVIEVEKYVDAISNMAEKHLGINHSGCGLVIEDVIDQYEIRVQSIIEEKTELLLNKVQILTGITNTAVRNNRVETIISELKEWDRYVQPLQLKAQYEGYVHGISEEVAIKIRNASIVLNNEMEDVENAEKLVNVLKVVFAEMPEFLEIVYSDSDILERNKVFNEIVKQQKKKNMVEEIKFKLLYVIIMCVVFVVIGFIATQCDSDHYSDDTETSTKSEESYEDSEPEKVTLKEKKMPENEHIFVNEFNERPSQIIVNNPSKDAYYMKFENKKGKTVFAFFVRPESEAPMYMGLGTFYLKYASGRKWYGEKNLFGDETNYYESDEEWPFVEGKYWTLDLQVQENGNASTSSIAPEDF